MLNSAHILSAGRDPALLASRNEVLRRQGHTVVTAVTFAEIVESFFAGDFDVIVLCHTVPDYERRKIIRMVHNHAPRTPVLVLSAYEGQGRDEGAVPVPNHPQELVEAVELAARKSPPGPGLSSD